VKPLYINVDEIREAAQPWEADLPREDLDEMLLADPPTEYHAGGAAHVRSKLTKMGRKVLVQSQFSVPLTGECKRCLKAVSVNEPVDLTLTFVPAPEESKPSRHPREGEAGGKKKAHHKPPHREPEAEGSFDPQTADEELYRGKTIDLAPALREQVLLATPPSPLCREDCKGLCATCGKDLNQGDCGHLHKPADPRWEALKALKLELKGVKPEPKQQPKKE
jgi:uncharacterized protein